MSHVSSRSARRFAWIAIPLSLLASGLVVSQASYAAFSGATDNAGSNWTAGSVSLSDDDAGSALFSAESLVPGASGENCITVTSGSSVDAPVRLYAANGTTTNDLADNLTLTIEQGTGGGFGSCDEFTAAPEGGNLFTGSLAELNRDSSDYATGLGAWTPKAGEQKVYHIAYSFDESAPNTVQGGTAGVDLIWEAQSL